MSDNKPTPGNFYEVRINDTIRSLARAAYGNDQSQLVVQSNWETLRKNQLSPEGLPYVYPGNRLWFPPSTSRYGKRQITADFDTEITIEINGERFRGFKASRIVRALNNIADGFVFEAPFDYRNRALVEALRPFGYKTVVLYIGKEPYLAGRETKWTFREDGAQIVATVEVRTMPGDMIECMNPAGCTEYRGGLLEIGEEVAKVYGLRAYSANGRPDPFPEKVNKEKTETDADFLFRIAAQQGFLVTSSIPSYDDSGHISSTDVGVMFVRAATEAKPVATLKAGEFPVRSVGATYDGTKRFSVWTAVTDDNDEPGISKTLQDKGVPILRPFVFQAPDVNAAMIEQAVKWRMAKSIADSVSIPVQVVGWRNADGQLWTENMKVVLYAPCAFVFEEMEFLIQGVELTKDEGGGDIANLALVLPEAYSLGMPVKFPWATFFKDKDKGPV